MQNPAQLSKMIPRYSIYEKVHKTIQINQKYLNVLKYTKKCKQKNNKKQENNRKLLGE